MKINIAVFGRSPESMGFLYQTQTSSNINFRFIANNIESIQKLRGRTWHGFKMGPIHIPT